MLRSAASRVMWVGRATVFLVGLAVVVALVVGLTSAALAHTNVDTRLFHLGHDNPVAKLSKLTGNLAGAVLKVNNNGTGPALSLETQAGRAPLKVNSSAGKATNLNADKLDGIDSSAFLHVLESATITYDDPQQIVPANGCIQGNAPVFSEMSVAAGNLSFAWVHSNFPDGLSAHGMVQQYQSSFIAFRLCNHTAQPLSPSGGTVTVSTLRP